MTKESTIMHIDPGTPIPQKVMLLEGRLGALREMKEEFVSERDKRNGYGWKDLERMTLNQILFNLQMMIDDTIHHSERELLFKKYEITKKEIQKMHDENTPQGVDGWSNKTPPRGEGDKGNARSPERRTLELIHELRKARATIQAQFDEIKTQAKSKISALKKSEDLLIEQAEPSDQEELFDLDPSISEEVQKIVNNPIL